MTKTCQECGVTFAKMECQLARAFSSQKYCSRKCQNKKQTRERLSVAREQPRTVPPQYLSTGRQRDKPTIDPDYGSDYIPSGLLAPRTEPPDRIRAGVIRRMMQGATI